MKRRAPPKPTSPEADGLPPISEMLEKMHDAMDQRECLHPQAGVGSCSGGVIRSHSVARAGSLMKIADANHVMSFFVRGRFSDSEEPVRVGVNKASTFTGFCAKHDDQVFAPLEKKEFISSTEQAFLLAYRALCTEVFAKRGAVAFLPSAIKALSSEHSASRREVLSWRLEGAQNSLKDLDREKKRMDAALLTSDFSAVRCVSVTFDRAPCVVCAGTMLPEFGFGGEPLQDLRAIALSADAELQTFSLIATEQGAAAVFAWMKPQASCRNLAESYARLAAEQPPHATLRFVFEHFENSYFSPVWWNTLSPDSKKRCTEVSMSCRGLDDMRSPDYLKDDGMRAVDWGVVSVYRNYQQ